MTPRPMSRRQKRKLKMIMQSMRQEKERRAKRIFPNETVDVSKEWKLGQLILPVRVVPRPQ